MGEGGEQGVGEVNRGVTIEYNIVITVADIGLGMQTLEV